jgi:hypothetical protein
MVPIIFAFVTALAASHFCGSLILYTLQPGSHTHKFRAHLGYAYAIISYYIFYILLHNTAIAAIATLILPLATALLRFGVTRMGKRSSPAPSDPSGALAKRRDWIAPAALAICVFLMAAWPYLLTGWGNFWLSGNYDIEDGLKGRDAYVEQRIFGNSIFSFKEAVGDQTWYDFLKISGDPDGDIPDIKSLQEWYTEGSIRLQYSSLGFWSTVLRAPHGADAFIIQALLNLVLMAIGIYYLSHLNFGLDRWASAIAALTSTLCTFYLTTYFNGHEGSLMYGALIPALLHAVFSRDQSRVVRAAIGAFAAGAILLAYPHPLAVLAPPVAIYLLISSPRAVERAGTAVQRLRKNRALLWFSVIVVLLAVGLFALEFWNLTDSYRVRQAGEYRAWGYTRDWIIMPLMLGLLTPPLDGMSFAGSTLNPTTYILLCSGAAAIIAFLLAAFLKARPLHHHKFLWIFALCWFFEFLIFRYVIIDSYYVYKFLYTNIFIFIIGITAYAFKVDNPTIKTGFILLLAINVFQNITMARSIYRRPFNHRSGEYRALAKLDRSMLEKSFIELSGGSPFAIRQILNARGIQTETDPQKAEYFILPSDRNPDVTDAQFTNEVIHTDAYSIMRAPSENLLLVRTRNYPERRRTDPVLKEAAFRWVSQGRQDNLGIYISRPSSSEEMAGQFLKISFNRGPSAVGELDITLSTANNHIIKKFPLTHQIRTIWIPARQAIQADQPLIIRSGATGMSLLPKDDRILLYRVFDVVWTDEPYDKKTLALLNHSTGDIVENNAPQEVAPLHLGYGWHELERQNGVQFRWVGNEAELVVAPGKEQGLRQLSLDVEPGPSHGEGAICDRRPEQLGTNHCLHHSHLRA